MVDACGVLMPYFQCAVSNPAQPTHALYHAPEYRLKPRTSPGSGVSVYAVGPVVDSDGGHGQRFCRWFFKCLAIASALLWKFFAPCLRTLYAHATSWVFAFTSCTVAVWVPLMPAQ